MNRIFIPTIVILIQYLVVAQLSAQNRAPSVYLDYKDYYDGDIIMNTLRVAEPSPLCTYYNAMCFGGGVDGGGYCGMQNAPEGHNFIFSLWDPSSVHEAICAEYVGTGTDIANFGGEGTGLRSLNYKVNWLPNQWYTFVTRVWNLNEHSYYGFWIFDHTKNNWNHLVTMNYPVKNLKFVSRTSAFIEDWIGNGLNVREIHRKNGWKRKIDSQWFAFNQATISRISPDAGCADFIENYDGGVISNEYFFIKSGGLNTKSQTNISGTTINITNSNTNPDFNCCEISNLILKRDIDSLELHWDVNSSKSPQYSYTIELYNDASFSGTPITSYTEIKPHARQAKIKISKSLSGTYYLKMFINDIFDIRSNNLTNVITENYYCNTNADVSVTPNLAFNLLLVTGLNEIAKISIFDLNGNLLYGKVSDNCQLDISNYQSGLYIVKIETANRIVTKKFIKQ
jgi:hypothetical protein